MPRGDDFRTLTRDEIAARMNTLTPRGKYKGTTAMERYIGYVDMRGAADCWLWQAATNQNGHGVANVPGCNTLYAHQLAYLIYVGEVPPEMYVLHTCHQPRCCNPRHLYVGTQVDNMDDKKRADRHPHKYLPRLTDDEVWAMRVRRMNGEKIDHIAKSLGMGRIKVWQAITGDTFKHVGFPAATEQEQTA